VDVVGRGVTRFKPGDGYGGFAEYVSVPVDAMSLKPANLSFEEAAAVPMAAGTALQGLRHHGTIQIAQTVLINGASGGVGTFAVQIAKSLSPEVTGVTSSGNINLVRSLGADYVVDYTKTDFVRSGQRYDLILDTVGNRSVPDLRRALSEGGKASVTGFTSVLSVPRDSRCDCLPGTRSRQGKGRRRSRVMGSRRPPVSPGCVARARCCVVGTRSRGNFGGNSRRKQAVRAGKEGQTARCFVRI
jgi:NADPH:quinone reductase-like Zn-dependent oxidoreductase